MDQCRELSYAINKILVELSDVQSVNEENLHIFQTNALRLEVLAKVSLATVDIPLEVVDLLNYARARIKKACNFSSSELKSYEAPLIRNGERGRPKLVISEEQLMFFKGTQ